MEWFKYIVLCSVLAVETAFAEPVSVESRISELGNRTDHWVARGAFRDIRGCELSPADLLLLEKAAGSADHQRSQLSSLLLVYHHVGSLQTLSSLPPYLKTNLVVALRDDDINPRSSALPPNAFYARDIMVSHPSDPVLSDLLFAELTGADRQSARLASEVLVKWHDSSVPADERLADFLISDLRASNYPPDYFGVWRRLDSLGEANLRRTIARGGKWTEFQCAVLQILCAKYEIAWAPDEAIVEQWMTLGRGNQWTEYHLQNRVRQTALYLTPSTSSSNDLSDFPKRTRQLFLTEGHLRNAGGSEKFKWVCTWCPHFPK